MSGAGRVLGFAVAWLLLAGVAAFTLLDRLPANARQWALLVAFGPPLYVLGEGLGAWVFSAEHGQAVSRRRFSPARIVVALLLGAPLLVAGLLLAHWLSPS